MEKGMKNYPNGIREEIIRKHKEGESVWSNME